MTHYFEIQELAEFLCKWEEDWDHEEMLWEKYEISFESFEKLIRDLLPLCSESHSEISWKHYRGFSKKESEETRCYIVKRED